jgi:hypothetical protein
MQSPGRSSTFSYEANDTASAPIGDPGDQLWSRYLYRSEFRSDIFCQDSLPTSSILYPLKDGGMNSSYGYTLIMIIEKS